VLASRGLAVENQIVRATRSRPLDLAGGAVCERDELFAE
jgi:hypothetical protein